ncbi:MAG: oligoendopeptidase F [Vicinamibacterales bacterium]
MERANLASEDALGRSPAGAVAAWDVFAGAGGASGGPPPRGSVDPRWTWRLTDIFADWSAWEEAYGRLGLLVERYRALTGTLARGGEALLAALQLSDELGQLAYKVWYFAALKFDEDQRDNETNARRQQVQILLAKWGEATAWFNPELLQIPLASVRGWMAEDAALAVYRFALEDVYRQQEHVLDGAGEQLLSYASQFSAAPGDAYAALSTSDMKHPTVVLSDGRSEVVSYGRYRAVLATNRVQADRRAVFEAYHGAYAAHVNTYAALYHAILERDWFHARARKYGSTLEAALHGNNVPESVVLTLIDTTKAGVEPLRRYHRLRRKALKLETYHAYDATIPIVDVEKTYPYADAVAAVVASVAPLGDAYRAQVTTGFADRWIDVFENAGKRSGAYSASVYGVHPYMLLNYNDTLDDVFTLAHEMGHSMHTVLSQAHQPFVYASYTIFVAEVPSTLSEALLLEHLLASTADPKERIVLLQHGIDGIVGTFFTQVMFADFELQAHRLVEAGEPVTADRLGDLYFGLLQAYHGDALDYDERSRTTWARIPHFYQSPYYVYQYATCFASSAKIQDELVRARGTDPEPLTRYLGLLESGGSDYPMQQLRRAGVDLSQPETVGAVVASLDRLVTRLEVELRAVGLTV